MPAVLTSGVVPIAVGDAVRLPMDFGDVRQLVDGADVVNGVLVLPTTIASFDVTCPGTGAPAVSRKQLDYPYQLSAFFDASAASAGTYYPVYTITLDDTDATKVTRTGAILVS